MEEIWSDSVFRATGALAFDDFLKALRDPLRGISELGKKLPTRPRFFVYGAGNVGRRIAVAIQKKGYDVVAFIDNNVALHGVYVEGVKVAPFNELCPSEDDVCVIAIWRYRHDPRLSSHHARSLGFHQVFHFSLIASILGLEGVLPNYAVDGPSSLLISNPERRFKEVLEGFGDSSSQNLWKRVLGFHFLPIIDFLPGKSSNALPFDPASVRSYIDGGAFVGDDFVDKLNTFSGVRYAKLVEPDCSTFEKLARRQFSQDIVLTTLNAALSAASGFVRFNSTGGWDAKVVGGSDVDAESVPAVTVDECISDMPGPCYIKMDLEGHEIQALHGCSEALRRDDTIFSVTLEHRPIDIFEIPEVFLKYRDRTSFLISHDTEFRMDLVLYSVPRRYLGVSMS
jgi:FkbM family methyltransferase